MVNFEKIIEQIKVQSEKEARDIALKANEDTENSRIEYKKLEQDAYSAYIKKGTIKNEERTEKLKGLAAKEANKMITALEQDMFNEVLKLTADKLSALPTQEYNELLERLKIEAACEPEDLVELYRNELEKTVINALFN